MKVFFYAAALLLLGELAHAQSDIDISKVIISPSATSINKELARGEFHSFGKKGELGDITKSSFRRSLIGEWKYMTTSGRVSDNYTSPEYDDSKWQSVAVPMEIPLSNDNQIDEVSKPFVVELPVGQPITIFRRDFGIPLSWHERETILHINNLAGGSFIYINGQKVAYNEDSSSLAEFNITKYCNEGANQLTIVSYSHTAGTVLELGDNFVAGNIGDCYLLSLPKVMLRDYIVKSNFDPTYKNGLIEFGALIKTHYLNPAEVKVYFDLYDGDNKIVDSQSKLAQLNMKVEDTVYFNVPIRNVKAWNSEVPHLYRAEIRVQRNTRFTEFASVNIGFREVEIKDQMLYINGKPADIKGVSLKPADIPVKEEYLEMMLLQLKKHGVNALDVPTVQSKQFYDLTDKLGFYIFNTANLNGSLSSKSLQYALGNSRELLPKFLERTSNMYESVKSRPSVIVMALGESAGNGYNSYQSYLLIKDRDTSRPVVYNDARREWNSDIHLLQSPSVADVKKYKRTTHPAIAMDVDGSDIEKISKIVGSDNDVQGVFVADISDADNREVSDYFSNVDISVSDFSLTLKNNLTYSSLDNFEVVATIYAKDKVKASIVVPFKAGVGESETVALTLPKLFITRCITMIDVKIKTRDGVVIKEQKINI